MRLYYYTGKQWGLKVLWERRLKVAQYKDMNDPFELIPFNLAKARSRSFFKKQVQKLFGSRHGVVCLSEDWKTTLMWSHYAEKHTGMCLGFDVPDQLAEKITYVDNLLDDPLDHTKPTKGMTAAVFEKALRSKYSGWSYEREWRLNVGLENVIDGIYYREFDGTLQLREVVIGARCTLTTSDVANAVRKPYKDVNIFVARAAFGTFEVCKQERVPVRTVKGSELDLQKQRLMARVLREQEHKVCRRRFQVDPPCRSQLDPGMGAGVVAADCG